MSKNNSEIHMSVDIEADGPIPGDYSMLSLGAAAFRPDSCDPVAKFKVNLEPLADAKQAPDTMAWWKNHPEAWEAAVSDQVAPKLAMQMFRDWLKGLPGKPVFVGFPVTFDFLFVYWYYVHFVGFPAPFGFQGLDIKTLAMDKLGLPFRQTAKKRMPKHWFKGCPKHTHDSLEDAIGQGILFLNIQNDKSKVTIWFSP